MQILGAAHLFSGLIGCEFCRNGHINNLSVTTGGSQISRAECANAEQFGNLSCRFTQTWFLLTLVQGPSTKTFPRWRTWGKAVLVSVSESANRKELWFGFGRKWCKQEWDPFLQLSDSSGSCFPCKKSPWKEVTKSLVDFWERIHRLLLFMLLVKKNQQFGEFLC